MENPNQKVPSITSILKRISDDKALVLFNSIAVSTDNERLIPLREMNLSTKQYYSRISGLEDAGLIKRHKGKYFLTLLGKVVYDSRMTISKTLAYFWKLKAIESSEMSSSGLQNEEETQLINALIDNQQIKDILLKSVPVSSKSKIQESTPVITQTQV
jgi:hypothetical protein